MEAEACVSARPHHMGITVVRGMCQGWAHSVVTLLLLAATPPPPPAPPSLGRQPAVSTTLPLPTFDHVSLPPPPPSPPLPPPRLTVC
jgi:hypothetical protein